MKQRRKNIQLLILFTLLCISAIVLYQTGNISKKSNLDEKKFMVEDTASVNKVVIEGKSFTNILDNLKGPWVINNKYPVDPSMTKVLMAVLHEVRLQRRVPKNKLTEITGRLNQDGIKVSVHTGDKILQSFISGGNNISVSYFMGSDNVPFVVHLPGYDSYVSGIFEVTENDWRDRLLFSVSWAGLKKIELNYPGDDHQGFEITSAGNFPELENQSPADTARLMDYIGQFQYFSVDQFFDKGKNPGYDSLMNTKPWAVLNVETVSLEKPLIIKFFKKSQHDPLIAGIINDQQPALFSYERIKEIFKTKNYFLQK